jgi:phospholipid:diacylglycerol acyltransferase
MLIDRLPNAPSLKIYCLYGHGKETERSYWYMQGDYEHDDSRADAVDNEAVVRPLILFDNELS